MKKIVSFLTVLFFSVQLLSAQDFEVAPVYIDFKVEPGNIESRRVTITNHADKNQTFNLKLSDYEPDSTGRTTRMKAGESSRSLYDFLSITPSVLELPPNGQGYFDLTLTIPSDERGSKWGLVSVEATQERIASDIDQALSTGILINPRISIYVFQSPRSNTNFQAKVTSFVEITKPGDQKRSFEATVHNTGDKQIKAKMNLLLANIESGEETDLGTKTELIFPQVKKKIQFTIDPLEKGRYALAVVLDYGKKSNLEGSQIMIVQE